MDKSNAGSWQWGSASKNKISGTLVSYGDPDMRRMARLTGGEPLATQYWTFEFISNDRISVVMRGVLHDPFNNGELIDKTEKPSYYKRCGGVVRGEPEQRKSQIVGEIGDNVVVKSFPGGLHIFSAAEKERCPERDWVYGRSADNVYGVVDCWNHDNLSEREKPYEAILSCGMRGQHMNLMPCLMGDGQTTTELELTNGDDYRMYKGYDVRELGEERADGVHFNLKSHFKIVVQNAQKTLILTLKVTDGSTGKTLFQKSASQFGAIAIKN